MKLLATKCWVERAKQVIKWYVIFIMVANKEYMINILVDIIVEEHMVDNSLGSPKPGHKFTTKELVKELFIKITEK